MRTTLLVFLALTCPAFAAELSGLSWMAGAWHGTLGGGTMEEVWSRPDGPSMTGTFRLVEKGAVQFYEFMAIDRAADGLVLRIRHFDGDLTAWEDKRGALPFRLVASGKRRAVFENRTLTPPERLTYERRGDRLTILLETEKKGRPVATTFRFERR
jgi:hypothetical protein